MNLTELDRALRQLRLSGMAQVLEARILQAQKEQMPPIDLVASLVNDELTLRTDRLLDRRRKQAGFRDAGRTLDNFDFTFNPSGAGPRSVAPSIEAESQHGLRSGHLFVHQQARRCAVSWPRRHWQKSSRASHRHPGLP